MKFEIHKYRKSIVILFGLLPTIILLKFVIQSWWDIIDVENYYEHLINRSNGSNICFYEPPSLIWLYMQAILFSAICSFTILVVTFKPWTYLIYKIFLLLTFGLSIILIFISYSSSNIHWSSNIDSLFKGDNLYFILSLLTTAILGFFLNCGYTFQLNSYLNIVSFPTNPLNLVGR
jgi:hypothetical protein